MTGGACEVHYRLSGPEGAPAVVLSQSLGTDLSLWAQQAVALSERYRVVRYDLRGHGRSPIPPGPYTIADLGDDLVALLDRLEIERAALCGISIGAMTSIEVAARRPDRVGSLVLCCTSARFGEDAREAYRTRAAAVLADGLEPIADAVLERWFSGGFARAHPDIVGEIRARLTAIPAAGYAACCQALAEMDLRTQLGAITAPALVIAGQTDPATPPEHGRLIADRIPGARFELLPTAHLAVVEAPAAVTDLVLDYLEETFDE